VLNIVHPTQSKNQKTCVGDSYGGYVEKLIELCYNHKQPSFEGAKIT
jgi:hypothetical protein